MKTKKTKTKTRFSKKAPGPRRVAPPQRTKFAIRIGNHLAQNMKVYNTHEDHAVTVADLYDAMQVAMANGRGFALSNEKGDINGIIGLSQDCSVEVMPWKAFTEEQAQRAASQTRNQLGG